MPAQITKTVSHNGQMDSMQQRLRQTVETLSQFPTRNSLSDSYLEAAEWLAAQYQAIPGTELEWMEFELPEGPRIPQAHKTKQLIVRLPGTEPSFYAQSAHLDSRVLVGDQRTARAPGANDDASGIAVGLELARYLATRPRRHGFAFFAFTGEEQGLLGSKAMASMASEQNWPLKGLLNFDTVGSSQNLNGQSEARMIRCFSDDASREFARLCAWNLDESNIDFELKLVLRADRFGRGGDHTPFANQGFQAVRFTEVFEEWEHQHTTKDTVENMDFDYLAKVANAACHIAAPLIVSHDAPKFVHLNLNSTYDTELAWEAEPGATYRVYWRDTRSAVWEHCMEVGPIDRALIKGVNKDDHIFAVGAGGVPTLATAPEKNR